MIIQYLKKIKRSLYFYKRAKVLNKQKKQMLDKIHFFFNEKKLTYWLEYGTLLGAVRNNKIIPYDYDVDLSLLQSEWNIETRNELGKLGFQFIREIAVNEVVYEESYNYKGITVDLFYCSIEDNIVNTPVFRPFKNMTWNESLVQKGGFELYLFKNPYNGVQEILFENKQWYIPKNASLHLISYYGNNYMIPEKNWKGENAAIAMGSVGKVNC
ncbi:LicD family protein [Providencia rettgeri]|uniref:LicD family protein n=1 Tax=Providencia rettgeri TaxID=587 RepID=UPI0023611BB8|nr:LicD family protein [Providencia rettgeri]